MQNLVIFMVALAVILVMFALVRVVFRVVRLELSARSNDKEEEIRTEEKEKEPPAIVTLLANSPILQTYANTMNSAFTDSRISYTANQPEVVRFLNHLTGFDITGFGTSENPYRLGYRHIEILRRERHEFIDQLLDEVVSEFDLDIRTREFRWVVAGSYYRMPYEALEDATIFDDRVRGQQRYPRSLAVRNPLPQTRVTFVDDRITSTSPLIRPQDTSHTLAPATSGLDDSVLSAGPPLRRIIVRRPKNTGTTDDVADNEQTHSERSDQRPDQGPSEPGGNSSGDE